MEGILKFNLNDFDEAKAHKRAINATNLYIAIRQFYEKSLRERIKYIALSKEEYKIINDVSDELFSLLNDYGIDIYKELE